MKKVLITAAVALFFAAGTAQAAVVAEWDTTGKTGNEASIVGAGSAQVSAADLVRGAGLSPYASSNGFNSTGWNGSNADDYFQFGFSVANGYQVSLNELWISTRSSNTGPGTIGLYTSLDNFASPVHTITQSGTAYNNQKYDLSSLAAIVGSFSIRLMEIGDTQADGSGATASGGTFRLGDYYDGSTFYDIELHGETSPTPTPVPAAAWLLGSGLLGLAGLRRRQA